MLDHSVTEGGLEEGTTHTSEGNTVVRQLHFLPRDMVARDDHYVGSFNYPWELPT